jgi:alanine racemase
MQSSAQVQVNIDLSKVRANVASISKSTGVDVIGVVKADAYGLGVQPVVEAISDMVAGWCVFSPAEAYEVAKWNGGSKPILILGPSTNEDPNEMAKRHIRPSVWSVDEAKRMRAARPVLCVDTGMRRFACPPEEIDAVIAAGEIDEAFTHATRIEHVQLLTSVVGNRGLRLHAAASALLDNPAARLDAVRPGLAMYRGAAKVSGRLIEVHHGRRPAGYSGFVADHFGVIVCGYSQGLRRGPCIVNGQRRGILEVGMQTAFVELGPQDRDGDEVVLLGERSLGDGLTEAEMAAAWDVSEQQVLRTLCGAGIRSYRNE